MSEMMEVPKLTTVWTTRFVSIYLCVIFVPRLMAFRRLLEKAAELPELSAWLAQAAPEQCVPTLWDSEPASPPAPHSLAMYRLLLIQVFDIYTSNTNGLVAEITHLKETTKLRNTHITLSLSNAVCINTHNDITVT